MHIEKLLPKDWFSAIKPEFSKNYFLQLNDFLEKEYKDKIIFPPKEDLFQAFELTKLNEIKVVILGQDPYHGANQAHGLCFSVNEKVKIPPSLRNIFSEMVEDLQIEYPIHGNLKRIAAQGVLLLNTVLTVRQSEANSHRNKGWEHFTDAVIQHISDQCKGIIFMLWGNDAQKKEKLINTRDHYILKAAHPSPLSAYRGFKSCKHFSKSNEILQNAGEKPIDWRVGEY